MTTQATEPAKRRGRQPLPEEQKLVGNGIHMRPTSKRDLIEVVAFQGITQRQFLEDRVATEKTRIGAHPDYKRWVDAGRPIPFQAWKEAGMPPAWDGDFLKLP